MTPAKTLDAVGNIRLPRIAITMGDPAGIGPEVCLKLLMEEAIHEFCVPIILGDQIILNRAAAQIADPRAKKCLLQLRLRRRTEMDFSADESEPFDQPTLLDFGSDRIDSVTTGHVAKIAGEAAFQYIGTAIDWHLRGVVDAVTTGPINKLALHAAGHHFPGHTEIFARQTGSPDYCMMQYSDELTCAFVTTHVGYDQVPGLLTIDRIGRVIQLSVEAVRKLRGVEPAIVVCGLNPHAGESGLFGNGEEEQIIAPAIELARQRGINVSGPFPPDTCFIPSRRAATDCFICMYHDQGHIPLKALVFDKAVNLTLGLPIIRTSVDHGTAFDIAGQDRADASSMFQAVRLAATLARDIVVS